MNILRKAPRRLTKEEYDKIYALHDEGKSDKEIARITKRSQGTVSYVINCTNKEVVEKRFLSKKIPKKEILYFVGMEEEDFSSKSDDVLFKHTREYIF